MIQMADKLDWLCISQYQTLSEPFMLQMIDKLNLLYIYKCQNLSEQFKHQIFGEQEIHF